MSTYYIFDIDVTLANNDARARLLKQCCVVCGRECISVDGTNRPNSWACPTCGATDTKTPQSSWDQFTDPAAMYHDLPVPQAQEYMRRLVNNPASKDCIHFITGRKENCRIVTEQWLSDHYYYNPNVSHLIMRPMRDDGLPASVYKERAFLSLRSTLGASDSDIFYFFEDDKYVFSMYQSHGIVMQSPEIFSFMNPPGSPRELEQRWSR